MSHTIPPRPATVPLDARFNEEDKEWELGEKNAEGKPVGRWQHWRSDGTLLANVEWGDGKSRVCIHRYHPNGVISQYCEKDLIKDIWVGTIYWTKIETESDENRYLPAPVSNARRVEFDYNDKGHVVAERIFDKDGVQITHSGTVFPAIPPNVDPNAVLHEQDRYWISWEHSNDGQSFYGCLRKWDRNGQLQEQQQFDDDGKRLRYEQYDNGHLWLVKEYKGDEYTQSFYRNGVMTDSTLYHNDRSDRTTTLYNKLGKFLYSKRLEKVSDEHARRYYNDVLVLDAKWSKEGKTPPEVKYYDGDRILVDYTSNGDNTGSFTLYKGDGSVEATLLWGNEQETNEYGHWDSLFMPSFGDSDADRKMTDVEYIRSDFLSTCEERAFEQFIENLQIPEHLDAIRQINWKKSRSANKDAPLDKLLVLFLGDDKKQSKRAYDWILGEIEEQDCLFDATYDVALTLTRLLPTLSAPLQWRAMGVLTDIFAFPALPYELPERYTTLLEELRIQLPLLEKFARTKDNGRGRAVLFILSKLNAPAMLRKRLFDTKASPHTRAYAACALSVCRNQDKAQHTEAKETFHRAFFEESNEHVRVILGVLLSLMTGDDGSGDIEINRLLLQYAVQSDLQDELDDIWYEVSDFLGEDISTTLFKVIPKKKRLNHIDLVIDGLASRYSLDQAKDFDTIFYTLFNKGEKTKLTDLHRKALLAIADIVDQHPTLVNQGEIFRKHNLPWDSFKLRELANSTKVKSTS